MSARPLPARKEAPRMASLASLVVMKDGALVTTEALAPGQYVVGSGRTARVHLPGAPRIAAVVSFDGRRIEIEDGGEALLHVNGKRVDVAAVGKGDIVAVGRYRLAMAIAEERSEAPAPSFAGGKTEVSGPPEIVTEEPGPARRRAKRDSAEHSIDPFAGFDEPSVEIDNSLLGSDAGTEEPGFARRRAERDSAEHATDVITAPALSDSRSVATAAARPAVRMVTPLPARKAVTPPPVPRKAADEPARAPRGERRAPRPAGKVAVLPTGSVLEVRTYWKDTLVANHTFDDGTVKAGAHERADVQVYSWPTEKRFVLARRVNGRWVARLPQDASVRGTYAEKGESLGLYQLEREGRVDKRGELTLAKGARLTLQAGLVTIVVEEVAAPPRARPRLLAFDRTFLTQLGSIALLYLVAIVFMPAAPPPSAAERPLPPPRAIFRPPKKAKPRPPPKETVEKKDEGKKDDAPKAEKKESVKKASKAPPPRLATPSWAIRALGNLSKKSNTQSILGSLSKIQATGGAAAPSNYRLAGLAGKGAVNPLGIGALGGGGLGGPLTAGAGSLLGGRGGGIGALGMGLKGVGGAVTRARPRAVQVRGQLSREEIAKVVNDHLKDVQYCYERALIRDSNVSGKLLLEWTIDLSGDVTRARIKESSVRNPEVGGCVVEKLRTWQFPHPRGGIVIVSYPFLFNSVGY